MHRIPAATNLLNSGSKAMNVNGSVTPVVFSYTPSVNTNLYGFTLLIEDTGTSNLTNFGSISALTNGLLVELVKDSENHTIMNPKDNSDLFCFFESVFCGNGSVDSLGSPSGFGDSIDFFRGVFRFSEPIALSTSDKIQITVRDNLSGLGSLQTASLCVHEG